MSKRRNDLKPKVGYEDLLRLFNSVRLIDEIKSAKDFTFREGYDTKGYVYFDPRNGNFSVTEFFIYEGEKPDFEPDKKAYPPVASFVLRGVTGRDDRLRMEYTDMLDLWDLRAKWMEQHRIYTQPISLIGSVNDNHDLGFIILQDREIRDPRERITSSRDLNVLFQNRHTQYPEIIIPELNQFNNGECYTATCAHFNNSGFNEAFLKELKNYEITIQKWKS